MFSAPEHCSADEKIPTDPPAPPKPKTDPHKPTKKPNPQPEPEFKLVIYQFKVFLFFRFKDMITKGWGNCATFKYTALIDICVTTTNNLYTALTL